MVNWQYYPKSDKVPSELLEVVSCFERVKFSIRSPENDLSSNQVLDYLRDPLTQIGFKVEGHGRGQYLKVPVLFGRNGRIEKSFNADAFKEDSGVVIEVEAGRGVLNYQFLKDFFEACVMHDANFLVIAVRKTYKGKHDFETVVEFFETLYSSRRFTPALKGVLLIGY